MNDYIVEEYTFEALCLKNGGPQISTLAYVVGLVDSPEHEARNPDTARYGILYLLSEAEENMQTPEGLLDWQRQVLTKKYLPQTPVMFMRRWSPIMAMLTKG